MEITIINGLFTITRDQYGALPTVGQYINCGVYGTRKVAKVIKTRNRMHWTIVVE